MTFIYFFIFNPYLIFFLTFIPIYYNIIIHVITELLRGFLYHLHISAAYIPPFNVIEVVQNVRRGGGGGGARAARSFFFFLFFFFHWGFFMFMISTCCLLLRPSPPYPSNWRSRH